MNVCSSWLTFLGSRFKVFCLWEKSAWLSLLGATQRSLNFRLAGGDFVGFGVLPRVTFQSTLHLCDSEAVLWLCLKRKILDPQKFFPCNLLFNDFTDTKSLNSKFNDHLSRLSPLARLSAQVTQILEDNFVQGQVNVCGKRKSDLSGEHPGFAHEGNTTHREL